MLGIYFLLFGVLIIALEFKVPLSIETNFAFLRTLRGRAFFIFFLACLCGFYTTLGAITFTLLTLYTLALVIIEVLACIPKTSALGLNISHEINMKSYSSQKVESKEQNHNTSSSVSRGDFFSVNNIF